MMERMNRLLELRGLRRSIAEKDARLAKIARDEFERKVNAAEEAHARALADAATKRRSALDTLMDAPATPLNVARMANVSAMAEHDVDRSGAERDTAADALEESERELAERRDVLAEFLRREDAAQGAIARFEDATRHVRDAAEEDEEN